MRREALGRHRPRLSPPPVRARHRRGEARERRLEPEARPAGSERAAAGARPRRGRGKKNTLFPLGPPPRIMYQDYPGNFDTSSRGSSGSPAHAESYTSGGGQQPPAGPGLRPWAHGAPETWRDQDHWHHRGPQEER